MLRDDDKQNIFARNVAFIVRLTYSFHTSEVEHVKGKK
jgi:hypothetical protein